MESLTNGFIKVSKCTGTPLTDGTVFAKDPGIFLVEDNVNDEMLIMTGNN